MSAITTHVLDTARGRPASGVLVELEMRDDSGGWRRVGRGATDADGRLRHRLGAVVDAEFLQNGGDVRLHGRLRYAELVGDLLVEKTFPHHHQHAKLLRRQASQARRQRSSSLQPVCRSMPGGVQVPPARIAAIACRMFAGGDDFGTKPAAPSAIERRIVPGSSFADTTQTERPDTGRGDTSARKSRARPACSDRRARDRAPRRLDRRGRLASVPASTIAPGKCGSSVCRRALRKSGWSSATMKVGESVKHPRLPLRGIRAIGLPRNAQATERDGIGKAAVAAGAARLPGARRPSCSRGRVVEDGVDYARFAAAGGGYRRAQRPGPRPCLALVGLFAIVFLVLALVERLGLTAGFVPGGCDRRGALGALRSGRDRRARAGGPVDYYVADRGDREG